MFSHDAPIQAIRTGMSYLEGSLGYALYWARQSVVEGVLEAFADHQITMTEFLVLVVVAENPGISQADLVEVLDAERPRIVPALNKLKERGLASQAVAASDGGFRRIHLTGSGQRLVQVLRKRDREYRRKMMARLDATEAKAIFSSLWKLAGEKPGPRKTARTAARRSRTAEAPGDGRRSHGVGATTTDTPNSNLE